MFGTNIEESRTFLWERMDSSTLKRAIERNDLSTIREEWERLKEEGECERKDTPYVDYPTLFQTVYLHACLKKKRDIATWLETTVFPSMDPIQQIALRQVFSYGKYLLKK